MENIYKVKASNVNKNSRRYKSIERLPLHPSTLDAGCENKMALSLGITNFINTDLNYKFSTKKKHNTVTSFEVIEHLQNPLTYLESIYNCLGILYLTTPVKWMFKGKYHFHEFTKEELLFCLKLSGFQHIHIKRVQAYNLRHFGIRPLIRKIRDLIYGQCFLVTAVK